MLKILNLENECTGCTACKSICPMQCIKMKVNDEGFLFPEVDLSKCIHCGLCDKICPVLTKDKAENIEAKAYYGWHKDKDIRSTSTSGGLFSAFAEYILSLGGTVYGAVFDAESKEIYHVGYNNDLYKRQRRSKYVESNLKDVFNEIKFLLDEGRNVVFTSSPCHVAGLAAFLGEKYDNLLTCDFVCQGVPSSELFKEHLTNLEKRYKSKTKEISFRNKTFGWSKTGIHMYVKFLNNRRYISHHLTDEYYRGFISYHISLRKCCYRCSYVDNHFSDIILADFWEYGAVDKKLNDRKGISLIISNTEKGERILKNIEKTLNIHSLDMKYANYVFVEKKDRTSTLPGRDEFFQKYKETNYAQACRETYMKDKWLTLFKLGINKFISPIKSLFR